MDKTKEVSMKSLFLIALLSFNVSASVYDVAVSNFKYVADADSASNVKENLKTLAINDVNKPFSGDCDDFAFSLQKEIGGKVWYTSFKDEGAHAVLVKDGIVFDFYKGKMPVNEYPSKLLFWFDVKGNYGTDI
jgi:hypothetical protein